MKNKSFEELREFDIRKKERKITDNIWKTSLDEDFIEDLILFDQPPNTRLNLKILNASVEFLENISEFNEGKWKKGSWYLKDYLITLCLSTPPQNWRNFGY